MRIRFKKFGSNTAFGSFQPGDLLTCSESMARHLVEQAGVAEYVEVKQPELAAVKQEAKRRRKA